jgi:hypothetical protein
MTRVSAAPLSRVLSLALTDGCMQVSQGLTGRLQIGRTGDATSVNLDLVFRAVIRIRHHLPEALHHLV